jgi:xanthine dehydrogenase accessory factor
VSVDGQVTALDLARSARDALRGDEPFVGAVLIETRSAPGADAAATVLLPGSRMLVWAEKRIGSLGDPELDEHVAALAEAVLRGERAGARDVAVGGATHTVYLELYAPPPELVIVGAGHIARPLCRVGAMLGFRVIVLDDRPEFATRERFPEAERLVRADFAEPLRDIALGAGTHLVLVTRGHKYDYEVLRDVLSRPVLPVYIGMIGSRRRTRAALEQLAREGIPREKLLRIHAPIGLDIGAETPEEIAVAIAAEVVRLRRGGTAQSLRERERVVERWIGDREEEAGDRE